MANRNPNPRRYNLTIAHRRPNTPFGGTGGGLACHHAIPYHRLRDFWNRAVRDNLDDFRGTFLEPFAHSLLRYPIPPDPTAPTSYTGTVAALLRPVVNGDVVHDGTRPAAADWTWVAEVYAWMPGNLFLGPPRPDKKEAGRGGDPGEEFDHFASQCMPHDRYLKVQAAYQAITTYLSLPVLPAARPGWAAGPDVARGRACRAAGAALAAVAAITERTPYHPEHWVGVGRKF
jgi:hypothetical protein